MWGETIAIRPRMHAAGMLCVYMYALHIPHAAHIIGSDDVMHACRVRVQRASHLGVRMPERDWWFAGWQRVSAAERVCLRHYEPEATGAASEGERARARASNVGQQRVIHLCASVGLMGSDGIGWDQMGSGGG